jgi:hypothetical protein
VQAGDFGTGPHKVNAGSPQCIGPRKAPGRSLDGRSSSDQDATVAQVRRLSVVDLGERQLARRPAAAVEPFEFAENLELYAPRAVIEQLAIVLAAIFADGLQMLRRSRSPCGRWAAVGCEKGLLVAHVGVEIVYPQRPPVKRSIPEVVSQFERMRLSETRRSRGRR